MRMTPCVHRPLDFLDAHKSIFSRLRSWTDQPFQLFSESRHATGQVRNDLRKVPKCSLVSFIFQNLLLLQLYLQPHE